MILQRDAFAASVAAVILCQSLIGQIYAADLKNSSAMVRVPGGLFLMGNSDGPEDERPQHQVNLAEFFIDRTPVTNAQDDSRPSTNCVVRSSSGSLSVQGASRSFR